MKTAKNNYQLIMSQIVKQNKLIEQLLRSKSVHKKINTISQLQNKNEILNQKIEANKQKMKFYKKRALLSYYKGEML